MLLKWFDGHTVEVVCLRYRTPNVADYSWLSLEIWEGSLAWYVYYCAVVPGPTTRPEARLARRDPNAKVRHRRVSNCCGFAFALVFPAVEHHSLDHGLSSIARYSISPMNA
jgi:hypothetical protein